MHRSMYVLVAAATLGLAASSVQAMPGTSGAVGQAADSTGLIEKTAVYIVEGRRYCFYFNGWQGPGWYRCGFASRRGIGWGGVYGWQGWEYGPAARRFGHGGVNIREGRGEFRDGGRRGVREGDRREGTTLREGTTTRERSGVRGSMQQNQTTTTGQGSQMRGGASIRGEGGGRGGPGGGGVQMNKSSGSGGGGGPGGGGPGGGGGGSGGGRGSDKQ